MSQAPWMTYGRAFVLTSGVFLLGLTAVIWRTQGPASRHWPWPPFAWALFGFMILAGLCCIGVAIVASRSTIEKRVGALPAMWPMLVIGLVAAPVCWAGRRIEGSLARNRGNRRSDRR